MFEARWANLSDLEPIVGISVHVLSRDPRSTIRKLQKAAAGAGYACIVAESEEDNVCGYLLYNYSGESIKILHLAVVASARRSGCGTALVNHLIKSYSKAENPKPIELEISEHDFTSQKFLKANNFKAVKVIKNGKDEPDSYLFRYEFVQSRKERTHADSDLR